MTKLMSYASQLLFIAKALFVAGAVLPVLVAVWAILGSVPRSVRSRYHGRVMYMAQLPFTEEWRRQVNPDDLPLIVRARRRRFVFLLTVLVVMQSDQPCRFFLSAFDTGASFALDGFAFPLLVASDLLDADGLAARIHAAGDPVSAHVCGAWDIPDVWETSQQLAEYSDEILRVRRRG